MKDLSSATASAASALGDAKDAAADTVKVVKDAADRTRERATELGGQAYARGKDMALRLGEEPVTTALIAGGIGLAIGYLLARR